MIRRPTDLELGELADDILAGVHGVEFSGALLSLRSELAYTGNYWSTDELHAAAAHELAKILFKLGVFDWNDNGDALVRVGS